MTHHHNYLLVCLGGMCGVIGSLVIGQWGSIFSQSFLCDAKMLTKNAIEAISKLDTRCKKVERLV